MLGNTGSKVGTQRSNPNEKSGPRPGSGSFFERSTTRSTPKFHYPVEAFHYPAQILRGCVAIFQVVNLWFLDERKDPLPGHYPAQNFSPRPQIIFSSGYRFVWSMSWMFCLQIAIFARNRKFLAFFESKLKSYLVPSVLEIGVVHDGIQQQLRSRKPDPGTVQC